jgi:hypothetical protein
MAGGKLIITKLQVDLRPLSFALVIIFGNRPLPFIEVDRIVFLRFDIHVTFSK